MIERIYFSSLANCKKVEKRTRSSMSKLRSVAWLMRLLRESFNTNIMISISNRNLIRSIHPSNRQPNCFRQDPKEMVKGWTRRGLEMPVVLRDTRNRPAMLLLFHWKIYSKEITTIEFKIISRKWAKALKTSWWVLLETKVCRLPWVELVIRRRNRRVRSCKKFRCNKPDREVAKHRASIPTSLTRGKCSSEEDSTTPWTRAKLHQSL